MRQVKPLPTGTEARIGEFAELVATAIANVQGRGRSWRRRTRGSSPAPTRRGAGLSAIA
jgi:hypothetical protein